MSNTYNRKQTKKPSQGLGDSVEKFTKATGIKEVVKFVAGEDCGCDERKNKLNALFPRRQPLCMTEEEYNWWTAFRNRNSTEIMPDETNHIAQMYTRLFQRKKIYHPCHCNPKAWQEMINHLNYIWDTYQ